MDNEIVKEELKIMEIDQWNQALDEARGIVSNQMGKSRALDEVLLSISNSILSLKKPTE